MTMGSYFYTNCENATKAKESSYNGSDCIISMEDVGCAQHPPDEGKPKSGFELLFDKVGAYGTYQRRMVYGYMGGFVLYSAFASLSSVFLLDVPEHHCNGRPPEISVELWKNTTLPWEKGPDGQMRHSRCRRFDEITKNETECKSWDYETGGYLSTTVPSDYHWVCEKKYFATLVFIFVSLGAAVGSPIFGVLADRYGRKPTLYLALLLSIVSKVASLCVPEKFVTFLVLQSLSAMALHTLFNLPSLLCSESSTSEHLAHFHTAASEIWMLANLVIPFIASILKQWFHFGVVTSVPGIILFLFWFRVYESPQWLVSEGKLTEAKRVLKEIARVNGKQVDEAEIDRLVDELHKKERKDVKTQGCCSSVRALCCSKRNLGKNAAILCLSFAIGNFIGHAMELMSPKISSSTFGYCLLAVAELPGACFAGKLADAYGRRWTHVGSLLFIALGCVVCAVAASNSGFLCIFVGAIVIKTGETVLSTISPIQCSELFPTSLRSTGSGWAQAVGDSVSAISPSLALSASSDVAGPYKFLFLCSILGAISSSFLPETVHEKPPETIDEADQVGRGQKFFSLLPARSSEEETKAK